MSRRTALVVTLVVCGMLAVYLVWPPAAPIVRAYTQPPGVTVQVVGAPGSFGHLESALATPTGHSVGTKPVKDWVFEPGKAAYFNALAPDGTILIANEDQRENPIDQTADTMVVSAYDPATGAFRNIRIKTSTGRAELTGKPQPGGSDLGDLETVGDAVAFTGPIPYSSGTGQDPATDGVWPVFGLLTDGTSGWDVASGAGWVNQWTANQLHDSNPALGDQACPYIASIGMFDCLGMNELAVFAQSRDVVVTQYYPSAGTGHHSGQLMVLRLTRQPGGRYDAAIVASYVFPDVRDPHDGKLLTLSPREVASDPTSVRGDERFAVGFDVFQADGNPVPSPIQEFSYNANTGALKPVSAPVLPGDLSEIRDAKGIARFKSYSNFRYDYLGNLWVGRRDIPPDWSIEDHLGGKLAVYAKIAGDRKLADHGCPFDASTSLEGYTSSQPSARSAWGLSCPADFDVGQSNSVTSSWGMAEDPVTHLMVQIFIDGNFMAVQPHGSGRGMTFDVGPVVDTGRSLLPVRHEVPGGTKFGGRQGFIDSRHHLWYPVQQLLAGTGKPYQPLDQWLFSVDTRDLFAPAGLPAPTGLTATVNADGSIDLSWVSPFPSAWFWVYSKEVGALRAPYTRILYPVSDGTTYTVHPSNLAAGHTYAYYVTTTGSSGESPPSALAQVTVTMTPPANLTATTNADGSVTLSWAPAFAGAWYWVYSKDLANMAVPYQHGIYPVTEGTTLTIPRSLLKAGHTYAYYVTAVGSAGESAASNTVYSA